MDLDRVGRRHVGGPISWSSSQALLYALGVGAGASGVHDELAFTTENSHDTPQQVLPTFAAVLAMRSGDGSDLGDVMGLLRGVVHEWMLQVPRQVKKFVESTEGRARYAE